MIRKLAPNELTWFIAQAFEFLGHSDPQTLARQLFSQISDLENEAEKCLILQKKASMPIAGMTILVPEQDADNQNLYISNLWSKDSVGDIGIMLEHIQNTFSFEAVHYPLYNHSKKLINKLKPIFKNYNYALIKEFDLEFKLSEIPPLGRPLVLEAWTHSSDSIFKEIYEKSEEIKLSDEYWAYLKRQKGAFNPNLWFLVREGLDQEPIGYAFYGAESFTIDGLYHQTEVGVLAEYRNSSEMLKRLLLSSLHELAAISPFGRVDTTIDGDAKLIQIFEELGFDTLRSYKAFVKLPE